MRIAGLPTSALRLFNRSFNAIRLRVKREFCFINLSISGQTLLNNSYQKFTISKSDINNIFEGNTYKNTKIFNSEKIVSRDLNYILIKTKIIYYLLSTHSTFQLNDR